MATHQTLVIGTAGHIDHGKSRLVHALTGTDPDRLPEERQRGMTIELGFAHTTIDGHEISFVDVPGHERFIRNMVAGATGIDLALLVVAADDSVMPQTREHAEVLQLLGVNQCVVALTKMDLVDDEWGDAVEEEVRDLLAALEITPLACVRTSAETGRGLDALRTALAAALQQPRPAALPYHWFRLPIDRAFVIAGRGTVVTGSVAHGAVEKDTELELWPADRAVRVRDLQTHHDARQAAAGKMRLAVNLAALSTDEVARGDELATPGYLAPTRLFDAWLTTLRLPGKALKQTLRLRLHIATTDVLAELRLSDKPGDTTCREGAAQIHTAEPIVATWGQPFILRDVSATRTLGGGRVLRPWARRWTARRPAHAAGLEVLRAGTPRARLTEVLRDLQWRTPSLPHLATAAGLADSDEAQRLVEGLLAKNAVVAIATGAQRMLIHVDLLEQTRQHVDGRLRAFVEDNPRLPGVPLTEWPGWMPRACPPRFRPALANWLIANEHVATAGEYVLPQGHKSALSDADRTLLEAALEEVHTGAFQPPGLAAMKCATAKTTTRLRELLDLATTRGQLVRIGDGMWLHAERWQEAVACVAAALREREALAVADIRTLLDSSRKYVVPIVERLDAERITRRQGDVRVLGPNAPAGD
jgi:selenocysteine-specific elongation factor